LTGLLLLVGLFTIPYQNAHAITRSDLAILGYSTSAHWKVGNYNRTLSMACQRREFSQKRQFRYIIGFIGKEGRAITGIATANWNLYDPKRLALGDRTYHFYNDGYSDCAVYVTVNRRT
jgi:hypothetical protein